MKVNQATDVLVGPAGPRGPIILRLLIQVASRDPAVIPGGYYRERRMLEGTVKVLHLVPNNACLCMTRQMDYNSTVDIVI